MQHSCHHVDITRHPNSSYVTTKLYGTPTYRCNNNTIFSERTSFTIHIGILCRPRKCLVCVSKYSHHFRNAQFAMATGRASGGFMCEVERVEGSTQPQDHARQPYEGRVPETSRHDREEGIRRPLIALEWKRRYETRSIFRFMISKHLNR